MTQASFHGFHRILATVGLLTLMLLGLAPTALAADPTPTPTPTPTPLPASDHRLPAAQRTPLPRGLLIGLAGLAGTGALVGLGAASSSLREREDETFDRFIEGAPR
ncbi:hypothetical protein [Luteococcus japonicus]|uniref:Uncharacterized protein n=1 Tax=Luteococcus japonicus LSP_Lj1 TaxID=1255658 RepID=A0A1R4KIU2_9ACTN|nr:hypothetical protein [Luteococcus japonicus]SJN44296.1 hypothetical protein FM114_14945 [Luteococcus japonicus LSP_Lj1]